MRRTDSEAPRPAPAGCAAAPERVRCASIAARAELRLVEIHHQLDAPRAHYGRDAAGSRHFQNQMERRGDRQARERTGRATLTGCIDAPLGCTQAGRHARIARSVVPVAPMHTPYPPTGRGRGRPRYQPRRYITLTSMGDRRQAHLGNPRPRGHGRRARSQQHGASGERGPGSNHPVCPTTRDTRSWRPSGISLCDNTTSESMLRRRKRASSGRNSCLTTSTGASPRSA